MNLIALEKQLEISLKVKRYPQVRFNNIFSFFLLFYLFKTKTLRDNFTKGYRIICHFDGMIPNYQNSRTGVFMYQKPTLKGIPSDFDIKKL
jgi:hypothetical protein